MKTRMWSAAALAGLFGVVVMVVDTNEPVRGAAAAPRVVLHDGMSVERAAHQATVLRSGQILITGGCAGRGCDSILSSAELYDPATRSFRSQASMATPRAGHAAISLSDGRVLVSGGWTGQRATASAEIYDPVRGGFTSTGNMLEARMSPIATALPDGRVLLTGGEMRTGAPLASAEVFDPVTCTFSAVGKMRSPRGSHVAVSLADGRVLVTGGHRARGEILRSAEIFDPATGEFQPTGDMAVPRHKHAAALLVDGTVLVIGGSDSGDHRGRYTSTEIYDPAAGGFSRGPTMRWPRFKLRDAVVVLRSGAVLVSGGAARPELWDPADRVFVPVEGELSGSQMFATADLLPTGEVLILGGYDDRIQPSASAWLVLPGR